MSSTRPYHELQMETLADPTEARHYLAAVIEDYPEGLAKALRKIAEARRAPLALHDEASFAVLVRTLRDLGYKLRIAAVEQTDADQITLVQRKTG
jgi:hypothetical protein